jgi:hypothetical protein
VLARTIEGVKQTNQPKSFTRASSGVSNYYFDRHIVFDGPANHEPLCCTSDSERQ